MNSSLVHESRASVLTINNMRLISDSGGRKSALARLQLPHRTCGGGVSRRDDVERVVLVLLDRGHWRDALVVRVGVQGASLVRRGVIVLLLLLMLLGLRSALTPGRKLRQRWRV